MCWSKLSKIRNRVLVLIGVLCLSDGAFSQSNTCYCYVAKADSTYTIAPMTQGTDVGIPPTYHCDNCSSQAIKLPFNFCFYGKNYDTVYINNKGNLTFSKPAYNFSTTGFPLGNDTLMLAPFYADIDDTPQNGVSISYALITYSITPTHMTVQWSGAFYNTFDPDLYDYFQITITNGADSIVPGGNNVSYCYWLMQWASGDSTGGSMGFNGLPATIGVNKGDHVHYAQFGEFDFPGHTYIGPFDTNNQAYWLNNKSFIFNTCVSGNNIPPVIINPSMCDTFTMCAADTVSFTNTFICPQPGQTATLTVSSPGLSGLTSTSTNANSVYSITTKLIAHLKDTGTHLIKIIATDNGSPALTDSTAVTVIIKPCGDTATHLGVNEISGNTNFTIYPNPNNGVFTIQMVNGKWLMVNSEVQIYNVLGEKIYSNPFTVPITTGNNSQFTINLSNRPPGVYFYRLTDDAGNLLGNGKFVIQ